jgi:PAS domain S-box-containing protein
MGFAGSAIAPWTGNRPPILPFLLAVIAAAWRGGLWPGLVATLIGILAEATRSAPTGLLVPDQTTHWPPILMFTLAGIGVSWGFEALLREKERSEHGRRELDLVTSRTPLFLTRCDRDLRYCFVNRACADFLERTPEDIVGRTVPEVLGSRVYRVIAPYIKRVLHGEEVEFEMEIDHPKKGKLFLRVLYMPERNEEGHVVGWVGTISDVTERRETERALRRSDDRLKVELADTKLLQGISAEMVREEKADALYEKILDAAVTIMDSDFASMQILYPERGSSGELRLLAFRGFPPEAARFWEWVRPDSGSTCAEAFRTGERVIVSNVETSKITAGTDDLITYREAGIRAVQSTPLRSRDGKVVGMISTHWRVEHDPSERELNLFDILARQAADLIERKKTAEALRERADEIARSAEALREADRRKDEFLAILAHELRNPLSPISNAAHYLKSKNIEDPDVRRPIEMIERQAGQMARLVDDLLDVSRITRGKLALRLEHLEFAEVAQAALDACHLEVAAHGHHLSVSLPEKPVYLNADRHRLTQLICNLVVNAARYTSPSGMIEFIARSAGSNLELLVRDNGIGIPQAKLDEIFELFAQVNRSSDKLSGLGIGLTLARQIAELHGGTIEARSDGVGHGSTFTLRLPVQTSPNGSGKKAPAPPVRARRILVADDNEDAAESMAAVLRLDDHEVRYVLNGEEALREVAAFRPEIAFLDLGMPGMNGYEVATRIRNELWGGEVQLVALTGWGHTRDRRRSQEAGFDEHIVKPASPETLDRVLREMDSRRERTAAQESLDRTNGNA